MGRSSCPEMFDDQIAQLLRPEAFPHPAQDLRLIETHISWVILTDAYAYKLRKPVNFGFVDFSTVEQRRADCEAELVLNRRMCPGLYLDVVNVRDREGRLSFAGSGPAIEPAVKMRRLPEDGMLPSLVERCAVGQHFMERLARQLADFHASAATGGGVDKYGSIATIRGNWQENLQELAGRGPSIFSNDLRDALGTYVEGFLAEHQGLFEQRVRQGRTRDGHGDLHARSVCLWHRCIYLFDCLEFDARFRCADVAAEVAFLAMDLDHLGRADLGEAFVDAYVRRSGDSDLRVLLDFYKCYRAVVRGKVVSLRHEEKHLDPEEAEKIASEARAYFELARAYPERLTRPPMLLVCMGLPASGKTTLAHALAAELGLVHVSSDVERKHLVGLPPTAHQAEGFERGPYSDTMRIRTYAILKRKAAHWLRRGQSVVLDATYGRPTERVALRQLARRCDARLLVVVCSANESVLKARLVARSLDTGTTSDARVELWPALKRASVEPTELSDALTVDTTQMLQPLVDQVVTAVRSGNVGLGCASNPSG